MYQSIAEDFMRRIFDIEADGFLITDESSLHDFEAPGKCTIKASFKKIQEEYDLDCSNIKSGNLLEIFQRIHRKQFGRGS